MRITTSPGFRFGWEGTEVDYVVKAEGAKDLQLAAKTLPGVEARLEDVRRTAEGVEGRVHVVMRDKSFV